VKNLKISHKLVVGFGVILLMLVISVFFASSSLRNVADNFDLFYNRPFMNVSLAIQIDMNSEMAAKNMLRACVDQDSSNTNEFLDTAKQYMDSMLVDLDMLKGNYTGDVNEITAVEKYVNSLYNSYNQFAPLARNNDVTGAYALYTSQVVNELNGITETIGVVREHASNVASESYNDSMTSSRNTIIFIVVLGILAVIIGILLALYITRLITSGIKQIQQAASHMSQGDFETNIEYNSKDELGSLADSMRETMGILKEVIDDIGMLSGELSNGNLTVDTRKENRYVGDLHPIILSLRKMKLALNDTLTGINNSSEQVNAGSDQVSSAAQGLAQGATQQASAVEELAATINDISNNINVTADHAKTAKTQNLHAHDGLQLCSSHMTSLVQAMNIIEQKSSEVGKISKTIEDIAFQTNILALNAAVEAARAGSAGKGFSVVADEVRSLASKVAEAAQNTTTLIEETINAVEDGTRISNETEESLTQVVTDAQTVLDAVVNISTALNQQSESIKQITQGIDQISSVVQTNSATAEQTAAASEELSGQAQILKDLVSVFTLNKR